MGNVSEGGLFIRTVSPLDMGTPAHLRFTFGKDGELEAEAVVVWRREANNGAPPGMGLKFVEIAADAKDRIRDFITRETTPEGEGTG
jgi:uncharacterized protein (TIGR02266 family)